jgi:hypothetical protein
MTAAEKKATKTTHMAHSFHRGLSQFVKTRKEGGQECESDYRDLGYCASNVDIYYIIIRVGTCIHGL